MDAENEFNKLADLTKGVTRATADEVDNLVRCAADVSDKARLRRQLQETFRILTAQLITLRSEPRP